MAMDLVVKVYHITKRFPKEEIYVLTSQLQRAVISVPGNIAEGQGCHKTRVFLNHLSIAHGSLAELETHIQIAERLNYINPDQATELMHQANEIGRLLNGLMNSLRSP